MREAVIVSAVRTAVGRALKGSLKDTRPDTLAGLVVKEAVRRAEGLDPASIDDVVIGCAMPEGEQGMNVARIAGFIAGLPNDVPAQTINRFCSSGLQSIAIGAERIIAGGADVVVAGGVESMTMVPMGGNKPSAHPGLMDINPEVYTPMGVTAEIVAERYKVTREDQDAFAVGSHKKAAAAMEAGKFRNEIVPVETMVFDDWGHAKKITFDRDEFVRPDTSMEGLAKLKPAFDPKGTVTAGNASPLSDGAAAVVVMEAGKARDLGLKPLARFVSFQVAGVPPEIMGIGPVKAIPKALARAGLKLEDIGLIELNEAFAAQSLAVIRELGINPEVVNVNGGAIALGHPLGCTGAKLTAAIINEMARRKVRYGMVSMCIGGGMGAAGVFENLQ